MFREYAVSILLYPIFRQTHTVGCNTLGHHESIRNTLWQSNPATEMSLCVDVCNLVAGAFPIPICCVNGMVINIQTAYDGNVGIV